MRCFGLWVFRWFFSSKEIGVIIVYLESYEKIILFGLQIDQMYVNFILNLLQQFEGWMLMYVIQEFFFKYL